MQEMNKMKSKKKKGTQHVLDGDDYYDIVLLNCNSFHSLAPYYSSELHSSYFCCSQTCGYLDYAYSYCLTRNASKKKEKKRKRNVDENY